MPYWEYEMYIKALSDAVKDENDQQKAEMKKYHVDDYMSAAKSGKLGSNMTPKMSTPSMPKMPSMGSFKF